MLGKHGGNLGEANSVAWMFTRRAYIVVEKAKADEEKLLSAALDAGADDMRDDGDSWEVLTRAGGLRGRARRHQGAGIEPVAAEIAMLPQNYVKLEGKAAQQMIS